MGFLELFKSKTHSNNIVSDLKNIEDFFNIDIHRLFDLSPRFEYSNKNKEGITVSHYSLKINPSQLSIFNQIEIISWKGKSTVNLVFQSESNTVSNELKSFIDFCVEKYGLDNLQRGSIVEKDYAHLGIGTFSRMWGNNVWISNDGENHYLELTLFSVNQKRQINENT